MSEHIKTHGRQLRVCMPQPPSQQSGLNFQTAFIISFAIFGNIARTEWMCMFSALPKPRQRVICVSYSIVSEGSHEEQITSDFSLSWRRLTSLPTSPSTVRWASRGDFMWQHEIYSVIYEHASQQHNWVNKPLCSFENVCLCQRHHLSFVELLCQMTGCG